MVLDILLAFIVLELFMIFMAILGLQDSKEHIAERVVSPPLNPFILHEPDEKTTPVVVNDDTETTGTYEGPQAWK